MTKPAGDNVVVLPVRDATAGVVGPIPILVEEGIYDFRFHHYETVKYGRDSKIVLTFSIVTVGSSFFESRLPKWYPVRWVAKHRKKSGQFKVGYHQDFLADYTRLFGRPQRLDRISFEPFRRCIVRGRVETVKTNSRQKAIPPELRYSVIRDLIGVDRG